MSRKILLAEDEEVLRLLIQDTLEDEGYAIDEAENGVQALELFQQNQYDLLVLDYMMPGMTGIEVTEKIRQQSHRANVKIMMLTAKSQHKDVEDAKQAGVDYFLSKPFRPVQLVQMIGEIMND